MIGRQCGFPWRCSSVLFFLLVLLCGSPSVIATTKRPAVRRAPARRTHARRIVVKRIAARRLAARLAASHAAIARPVSPPAQVAGSAIAPENVAQQRIPRQSNSPTAAIEGTVRDTRGIGIVGADITLSDRASSRQIEVLVSGDGIFRLLGLAPGTYDLRVSAKGYEPLEQQGVRVIAGDVLTLELTLRPAAPLAAEGSRLPRAPEMGPPAPPVAVAEITPYRELFRRPDEQPGTEPVPEMLPPASEVFLSTPNRWDISMPEWSRYGRPGEYPYVHRRSWDPFDRNRLKGDEPISPSLFGQQTFFSFTGTSDTSLDGRRLPTPTGVSKAEPGTPDFFGKGGQFALGQTFRFSFDLYHGDTSFRPVDWRIRITPAVNVNYLDLQELGVVSPDVRAGTTRLDSHLGLQEAFVEAKLRDLSPNYDFISARVGIQQFNADFRGFLFFDEQPGMRVFGTLRSSRWQYNAAYFEMLEKDTNSGWNTFNSRHQQVVIANFYHQDFLTPGYTAQFSIDYNKDDASTHYDDNGFLVRPVPIGSVRPHNIRAAYLGWNGDGHIGRVNVTHAFYQALGTDDFNPIAGRPVTINAQMAAGEASIDHDWMRFKISSFYASGDANPRDGRARGFDSIVDSPEFAGGIFSLWNREGIKLTGTGVALTTPDSLLPSLRPNKEEGQANFVNPGIFLANAGADFDLTPKLKSVVNINWMRFMHTEAIEDLLFQAPIHDAIGFDYSVGLEYRPPLTENISLRGGVSALSPGQGFRDIYSGKTLVSAFANVRLQF